MGAVTSPAEQDYLGEYEQNHLAIINQIDTLDTLISLVGSNDAVPDKITATVDYLRSLIARGAALEAPEGWQTSINSM